MKGLSTPKMKTSVQLSLDSKLDLPEGLAEDFVRALNQTVDLVLREEILHEQNIEELNFALRFVEKEEIQEYNLRFRDKDSVTDVLSFPQFEFKEGKPLESIPPYSWEDPMAERGTVFLGDVLICPERAAEQAEEFGHSLRRELIFLAVHAYLHILGYDHLTEEEEESMLNKQKEIMSALNINR